MTYKTKKKLIHFYTSGALAEDFAASKRKKIARFRNAIRACFYVQCAACVICAAAGFLAGFSHAIAVAICSGILLIAAFFATGGTVAVKVLSCILNFISAASGGVLCVITGEKAFGVCGGILLVGFIAACVSIRMCVRKEFLEEYPFWLIRREDYTMMRSLFDEEKTVLEELTSYEEPPKLPQLTTEMRELANRLSDILRNS